MQVKQGMYIGLGITLVLFGLAAAAVVVLAGSYELSNFLIIGAGLVMALAGWRLMVREAGSTREAISWLLNIFF